MDFTSVADFTIKQHDTAPFLQQTLLDWEGQPVDLSVAMIIFNMWTFGETGVSVISAPASNDQVDEDSTGFVTYEWQDGDTDIAGAYIGEWEVTFASGEVETFPNGEQIHILVYNRDLGGAAS